MQVAQPDAQGEQVNPSAPIKVPSGQLSIHLPSDRYLPGIHLLHLTSPYTEEAPKVSYWQELHPSGQVSQTPLKPLATRLEPVQTPEAGTVAIPTHLPLRKKVLGAHFMQSVAAGPLHVAQAALQTEQPVPVEN